jgi:hypothetical protein
VGHRSIIDVDTVVLAVVLELSSYERCSQVGDDPIGDAKSVGDLPDELSCLGSGSSGDLLDLNPLGEFVDCDVDVGEAIHDGLEGSDQVEPLVGERLRGWYCS